MADTIRISVDAMGGDVGPQVAIEGAALALRELRNSSFLFHGREAEITPILDRFPDLKKVSRVLHCDSVISMDDKPS
jgi:glycerol-3-phosphate acyltransferase PlsX